MYINLKILKSFYMILYGFEIKNTKFMKIYVTTHLSSKTGRKKYGIYDIICKAIWQFEIDLARGRDLSFALI